MNETDRLKAELQAAQEEAAFFRVHADEFLRVIQMAHDCFPDMPAVAWQTLKPYARKL